MFVYETPGGDASKPRSIAAVMGAAGKQIVAGKGPFNVTRDGKLVVDSKQRFRVLRFIRRSLKALKVGQTLRIRDGKGDIVFWVRAVDDAKIPLINTNGNDHADEFWSWVVATYPQYHPRFAGSYVCKDVAGSSTPSQHSYGNAVDIFFDTIEHQRIVFHDVVAGRAPVAIAHAISEHNIWDGPGSSTHYYNGELHLHLHTDYSPQYSGSCGVQG